MSDKPADQGIAVPPPTAPVNSAEDTAAVASPVTPKEYGGPTGKEPTRYGDWERGGRCSDF